jgi:hypothetical protein
MKSHGAGLELCLACQAYLWGLEVKDVQEVELILGRRQQILGTFKHVNATGAAARGATRKRNGGVVLVAKIHDRGTCGSLKLHDASNV